MSRPLIQQVLSDPKAAKAKLEEMRNNIRLRTTPPPEIATGWSPGNPTQRLAIAVLNDRGVCELERVITACDEATMEADHQTRWMVMMRFRQGKSIADVAKECKLGEWATGERIRRFIAECERKCRA